jgi:hypothetical protein
MTVHALDLNSPPAVPNFTGRQIELFAIRASELADRVCAGDIGFINGVDMLYSAAVWSGLIDKIGDDAVQAIMSAAFATAREPS